MSIYITILCAVIGSSGIASIVVALLQRHWSKKDKEDGRIDALVEAQQVLMVDRIRYLGRCYIKDGYIGLPDKETIEGMYRAYKALGGNGHLTTIMSEIEKLEVKG